MLVITSIEGTSKFISDIKNFSETEDIHQAVKFSDEEDSMKTTHILNKVREAKPDKKWCMCNVPRTIFGTDCDKAIKLDDLTISDIIGG